MKNVYDLLKENTKLSGWRVAAKKTVTHELFFVHGKLETARVADTTDTKVTVYVAHDGALGDSSFSVYSSMNEAEIGKKVETAVKRAELVFNQPYSLPQAETLDGSLETNIQDADVKKLGQMIADAVFKADDLPCGSINALEIFIYKDEINVKNSEGIDKTQRGCRVMIEAIPTYTTDKESVEVYEVYNFTDFDAAAVTEEIRARMLEVKARSEAEKPKTPLVVNVVLRPYEIMQLFSDIASDLNYATAYAHANLHKEGEDIQSGGDGDKINLTMRSVVKNSPASSLFDEDGTTLNDVKIIDNGVISGLYGSKRFGEYLGVERASGNLNCLELGGGSMGEDNLGEPYIECAFMSNLQVDLYNDYIGGEIRLAYYFDGKTARPVTGISFSARLSEVLKSVRFSEKTGTFGTRAYCGPEKMLLKKVSVL